MVTRLFNIGPLPINISGAYASAFLTNDETIDLHHQLFWNK